MAPIRVVPATEDTADTENPPPAGGPLPLPVRISSDAESVERDLFRLVLTVVELIRQLVEKQALRRMDDLGDDQVEAMGSALMRLDEAMTALRDRYGFSVGDLNIDLGPLGTLLDEG